MHWLAAYTRPRCEVQVRDYCCQLGIEVFLPSYQSWRRWSDRKKLLTMPLFPSYVFVCVDGGTRLRAARAPGFLAFVRSRSGVIRVDEAELESVRTLLTSGLKFDPAPDLSIGAQAEIVKGAMRGCRGFLLHKSVRSIILRVAAIEGLIRVELPDPSWIQPLRKPLAGKRNDDA